MKVNLIKSLLSANSTPKYKPLKKVTISPELESKMYNDILSCSSTLENAVKNTPYTINFFPKNNKEAYMEMGNSQYILKPDYEKSADFIREIYSNVDEYITRPTGKSSKKGMLQEMKDLAKFVFKGEY